MHLATTRCEGPVAMVFEVNGYELSVAFERVGSVRFGVDIHSKCDIRVFKGDKDVTEEVIGKDGIYYADEKDFLNVVTILNSK